MVIGTILAIILKLLLFTLIYENITKYYKTGRITIAWLVIFFVQNTIMIILSVFNYLNRIGLIVAYLSCCVSIYLIGRNNNVHEMKYKQGQYDFNKEYVLGGVLLFGAFLLRSLFFYDTTEDALIQGMPKLAFIQQHQSLFVKYDSATINTFSNECLGELNGLYYLLMSGEDRTALFGNAEVFLFIVCSFYYITCVFYNKGKYKGTMAFSMVTLPVVTGISMTIKTDLIAMAVFPLAVCFYTQYIYSRRKEYLYVTLLALAASSGAKISLLPATGLLLISLVIFYIKYENKEIRPVLSGIVYFLVFNYRYITNWIQYGNPFQRALNEKAEITAENFFNALSGILLEFNELPEMLNTYKKYASNNWVVNKGTGYAGYILLLIIIIAVGYFFTNKSNSKVRLETRYIYLPIIGGFLFFMFSTKWYAWSFRYVAPYVILLFFESIRVFQLVEVCHRNAGVAVIRALFLASILNALSVFRWGQAYPYSVVDAQYMSKTERKLIYSSLIKSDDLVQIPELMNILENGGRALVYDTFSYPYYHFFGDNHCVYVDLAYDEDALIEQYSKKDYDFLVIATSKDDTSNYANSYNYFTDLGYDVYETTAGIIFINN